MDCNSMDSLEEKMSGTLSLFKFFDILHLQLPSITLLISSFILVLLMAGIQTLWGQSGLEA